MVPTSSVATMSDNTVNEEEEEEEIDEEQVADYCAMLDKLGIFPEKASINALSIAAEDFSSSPSSASIIYNCIRSRLFAQELASSSVESRKLIPLVYVIDSLLKNVGGAYIDIILNDASTWMPHVHSILLRAGDEDGKARLKKVWNTWRDFGVVKDEERWKKIGECFLKEAEGRSASGASNAVSSSSGGFARNPDGSLQIASSLRKQMQILLDEVQNTSEVDELDKVSLERLAEINPDLLQQIKAEAEIVLMEQKQQQTMQSSQMPSDGASNLASQQPTLSDWSKIKLDHLEKSHSIVSCLQRHIRMGSQETTVAKSQCDSTIHLYAAVSASAQLLTDMLHQWKLAQSEQGEISSSIALDNQKRKRRYSLVKKEKFTTDGVKERNDAVIARLYEVGLPFVCSADGRRFATQLELSKHLDALFRKSQLEKMMEKTEERGWYVEELIWIGDKKDLVEENNLMEVKQDASKNAPTDERISSVASVIADETRDRCILCGINFAMFFDQEDGEWKYKNCVERTVLKDDEGPLADEEEESESVLVHETCWDGLGRPEFLTADQILHAR
ncbi:hypothetical protein HJC23_012475 [Cyclotella cryptica]|uniref:CID domain-containing protein n=1 Tax=Cyclotella cryptica TaxID=29204 RepID=A0ABD3PA16_9STRA